MSLRSTPLLSTLVLLASFATPVLSQDEPKPLPADYSFKGLFAERDYRYLQGAEGQPFRPRASAFEVTNAWWLAELSMLVYRKDKGFIRDTLGRVGLDVEFFSKQGTQAIVASGPDFVVVSFRGTEVEEPEDVMTDLKVATTKWGKRAGWSLGEPLFQPRPRVHKGFALALKQVWPQIEQHLETLAGRPVWFTGHSLGAALATLAADRHGSAQGVYTFGSPRVGNEVFAAGYRQPTFRITHNNDGVTQVPPPLGAKPYRHVGHHKHLTYDGGLLDAPSAIALMQDRLRGSQAALEGFLDGKVDLKPVDHLTDHAPVFYVTHLWNLLVAEQAPAGSGPAGIVGGMPKAVAPH